MSEHPEGRYCKSCRYDLRGSMEPVCPECGRAFDPDDPDSFFTRPNQNTLLLQWVLTLAAIVFPVVASLAPRICYWEVRMKLGYWPRAYHDRHIDLVDPVLLKCTQFIFGLFPYFMLGAVGVFAFSLYKHIFAKPRNISSAFFCVAIPTVWILFIVEFVNDPMDIWAWFLD